MSANIPNVLLNNSPTSASFLNLHFDILVLLASHLERSDLLSLMRVCRSLHAALVPHLLRSHPVIQRTKQLLSFSQFVMTDAPMRFVYLQRLSIAISYVWSTRIAQMLCAVFQYSTHLEELGILDCGCLEDSEIPSAIAALTCIRTLFLRYPTQAARDMLHRMRSKLTRVEVSFSKVPRHYMDPIELLASCHESLATLCMSLPRFSEVRLGLQYTALTKLVLKCHQAIQASPLLYHYPNVRHFTVTMCEGQCGHGGLHSEHIKRDDADIEEMRVVNTLDRTYSWRALDVLRGDVPSIYHLSLNCPVQRLELLEVGATDVCRFGKVMTDMTPTVLEVAAKSESFNLEVLPTLMRHVPMELHSLKFDIAAAEVSGTVQASMDDTFSVKIPSLVYFSLHWRLGFLRSEEEAEALAKISWEAYARRFAQINPALRFIALSLPFDGEIVAWQVSRGDQYYTDPIVLSTLSASVARRVMDELCL